MEKKVIQQMVLKFINTEIKNMEAMNRFGVAKNYRCVRNSLLFTRTRQSRYPFQKTDGIYACPLSGMALESWC